MKKVFAIAAVAALFVACGGNTTTNTEKAACADTTKAECTQAATPDTTAVPDTTACPDSAAAVADSAAVAE